MSIKKVIQLAVCVLIPLAVGFIGSLATNPSIPSWYAGLEKPSFSPPNWIFAPVWTLLFILMGIALFLVWSKRKQNRGATLAIVFFSIQMVLNLLWSILFFTLHRPDLALVEIIILWLFIASTIYYFALVDRRAAWLLAPYLAWVSFASILNGAIFLLN
jgi:tryptophan-rich sensory protein